MRNGAQVRENEKQVTDMRAIRWTERTQRKTGTDNYLDFQSMESGFLRVMTLKNWPTVNNNRKTMQNSATRRSQTRESKETCSNSPPFHLIKPGLSNPAGVASVVYEPI